MKRPAVLLTYTCTRCGNVWVARKENPARCPRTEHADGSVTGCGSPYWNKPRMRKVKRK